MTSLFYSQNEDHRNGAYGTYGEEGRAVLAHELTHVGQHGDRRLTEGASIGELESEAERSERKEYGISDPVVPILVGEHTYHVRKSEMDKVAKLCAGKLARWLEEQRLLTEPEEYLQLLVNAQNYRGQRI
jgi:hypothetical protein